MRHTERAATRIHLASLEPGEDLIRCVLDLARDQGLDGALVSGIGAVRDVEIGAFLVDERRYETVVLEGDWELLSLVGNLGVDEEQVPIFHPHVVLGDATGETRGGHLFAARCAVTVELSVVELSWPIRRVPDPATGLKLWSL